MAIWRTQDHRGEGLGRGVLPSTYIGRGKPSIGGVTDRWHYFISRRNLWKLNRKCFSLWLASCKGKLINFNKEGEAGGSVPGLVSRFREGGERSVFDLITGKLKSHP